MIDVNLRGVLNGIAAVLPIMGEQQSGHIINVASVSAYRVDPTAAVYCATKYAVRALSEGLRQESKELWVTIVSPGLTRTELFDGIGAPEARAFAKGMVEQTSIAPSAIAERSASPSASRECRRERARRSPDRAGVITNGGAFRQDRPRHRRLQGDRGGHRQSARRRRRCRDRQLCHEP